MLYLCMDFLVIGTMTPQLIDAFAQDTTTNEISRGGLVEDLDSTEWRLHNNRRSVMKKRTEERS